MKKKYKTITLGLEDYSSRIKEKKRVLNIVTTEYVKNTVREGVTPVGETKQTRQSIIRNSDYNKGIVRVRTSYSIYTHEGTSKMKAGGLTGQPQYLAYEARTNLDHYQEIVQNEYDEIIKK